MQYMVVERYLAGDIGAIYNRLATKGVCFRAD